MSSKLLRAFTRYTKRYLMCVCNKSLLSSSTESGERKNSVAYGTAFPRLLVFPHFPSRAVCMISIAQESSQGCHNLPLFETAICGAIQGFGFLSFLIFDHGVSPHLQHHQPTATKHYHSATRRKA